MFLRRKNIICLPFTIYHLLFTICYLLFAICSQPAFAKKAQIYTPESNYKYQQKILRQQEIEKYERSLLPESGNMTREEYEQKSKDVFNADRQIPEYKLPKDINMKYVPQPTYKLTRYNDPPGSVELTLGRSFKFDRKFVSPGIVSPNKDLLVYPEVYYYAVNQCTGGDLFAIDLDKSLPDVSRIQRANIIKRNSDPILSTQKDIREKFTFRTMTPVDFSPDGTKLLAKEKIGNSNDGIWQTNLWVYDFRTHKSRQLLEIREAIKFYWAKTKKISLTEKRWDIRPLGFDAKDPERVVVEAYGYTGRTPIFLGIWSIDCQGQRSLLLSTKEETYPISISGYKIVQDDIIQPAVVEKEEQKQEKSIKQKRKKEEKAKKQELKKKKQALNKRLKEMKKEESSVLKQYNPKNSIFSAPGQN